MGLVRLCVTNDLIFDQRLSRMAQAIIEAGYDVQLIGRFTATGPKPGNDIAYKRIRCWFSRGPAFYLEFNLRLWGYLVMRKTNILVANDADTLLGCGLATWIKGNTLVYDSHEWFTEVPELQDSPFKRKIWHWIQKAFIPTATKCLTVGPKLANRLSSLYQKDFTPIRNLPLRSYESAVHDDKILLYQGTLNVSRGLEESILALKGLPNWVLWIAGSGPLHDALVELVENEELTERVVFYGGVDPEVLRTLTPRAKIGLNVLKGKSKNYYFSLANKFFDYIQAGVPVITMDYPEYREHNEEFETAVLIDECSPEMIIHAVEKLSNPQLHKRLKSNCNEAAKIWNWDKEKEAVIALYTSLLPSAKD